MQDAGPLENTEVAPPKAGRRPADSGDITPTEAATGIDAVMNVAASHSPHKQASAWVALGLWLLASLGALLYFEFEALRAGILCIGG